MKQESKNFYIYMFSRISLNIGDSVYLFAISFFILYETGSAFYFALNSVIAVVTSLIILPFAGLLSDFGNKRLIILCGELFNAIVLLFVFIYTLKFGLELPVIYIATALLTVFNNFVDNSFQTALTELFSKEKIHTVQGYVAIIVSSSNIIGPIIGGVLFGFFNIQIVILTFAIMGLISFILDFFLKFELYYDPKNYQFDSERKQDNLSAIQRIITDMKEGIDYVLTNNVLRALMLYSLIINLVSAGLAILPRTMMIDIFSFEPELVGLFSAIMGTGTIIGGIIFTRLKRVKSPLGIAKKASYIVGLILAMLVIPIYFNAQNWVIFTITSLIGVLLMITLQFSSIPIMTFYQKAVDQHIKGRVFSLLGFLSMTFLPIGMLLFGYLYDMGLYLWVNITSAILTITATYFLFDQSVIDESDSMLKDQGRKH